MIKRSFDYGLLERGELEIKGRLKLTGLHRTSTCCLLPAYRFRLTAIGSRGSGALTKPGRRWLAAKGFDLIYLRDERRNERRNETARLAPSVVTTMP